MVWSERSRLGLFPSAPLVLSFPPLACRHQSNRSVFPGKFQNRFKFPPKEYHAGTDSWRRRKSRGKYTLQVASELGVEVLHSHLVQFLIGGVGSAPQDLRAPIPPSRLELPPQRCHKKDKRWREKKSEAKTRTRGTERKRQDDSPGSICFSRLKANTRRAFRSPIPLFVFRLKMNLINGMAKKPAA